MSRVSYGQYHTRKWEKTTTFTSDLLILWRSFCFSHLFA